MKRFLSITLILVLFVLSGCSGDGANSTASDQSAVSSENNDGEEFVTALGLKKTADGFPNKAITIYVDSDPGTETYSILQKFGEIASRYAEVDFTLSSHEGSSGVLALAELMRADADGYSMLHQSLTLPLTIGFETAPFQAAELQPIAGLFGDSLVVTVLPDSEFNSIQDIVAYAEENPAKFNWGGAKTKAAIHVFSAMFWQDAGIEVNYVPYDSGTDALVAVLGGNTMCNASSVSGAWDYVQNDELKILAVSTPERLAGFPDVPTFRELGYDDVTGYSIYRGSYAKAGIPQDRLEVLEQLHQLVSEDPEWIEYMTDLLKELDYRGTEEFTEWFHEIVEFSQGMNMR